MMVNPDVDG